MEGLPLAPKSLCLTQEGFAAFPKSPRGAEEMQSLAQALEVPADPGDGPGGARRIEGVVFLVGVQTGVLKRRGSYFTRETESQASSRPELTRLLSWFVENSPGLISSGEAVMVSAITPSSRNTVFITGHSVLAQRLVGRGEGDRPA